MIILLWISHTPYNQSSTPPTYKYLKFSIIFFFFFDKFQKKFIFSKRKLKGYADIFLTNIKKL